ncbi:MAG: EAL domain-containing protein [Rhodocyclaceae bacterium]|nr:EAL domain-containing protein [Rhodocyclaceae bacterium]MCE2980245.1 EAL domain-containing protein [Betaproteobacteria bacterium]MCA3075426.1 EAL domain-containing protein [Rhodocyclaceae bacterium]MCA3091911.1 EAL domain-containing protein [Rhodocyclaceae bacterium]MCA3093195.1 EAL domain-containing protein [Rhodocyclaceae bacterium]
MSSSESSIDAIAAGVPQRRELIASRVLLGMIAGGASLPDVLAALCKNIEAQAPGACCSVMLIQDERIHLVASPSLPEPYGQAIDRLPIGPQAGSCGYAAFSGQQVIVEDIATHSAWATYAPIALKHGLQACWSTPILGASGKAMATFAVYYRERRRPEQREIDLVKGATDLASIVIERDRSAEALRDSEASYRALVETAPLGIFVLTRDRFVYANAALARMLGAPSTDELIGRSIVGHVQRNSRPGLAERLGHTSKRGTTTRVEVKLLRMNGAEFEAELIATPMSFGGAHSIQCMVSDISERKHAERRINYLAHYDDRTGLPNRNLFVDRLSQALGHAQRSGKAVALLYLDLDRFKTLNDTLGHAAGDALLRAAGTRLTECVRAHDTVARLGGDEFALILADLAQAEHAEMVLAKIFQAFERPFTVDRRQLFVSTSIGIAAYPRDGATSELLLKHADIAMYRAKAAGRNTYRFYLPAMGLGLSESLALETDLPGILERGELELHYQPQIESSTGRIIAVEALLRWQHPQRGELHPDAFIPLLEETGLIRNVSAWAIRRACREAREWIDSEGRPLRLAINLSASQFKDPRLAELVGQILADADFDAKRLEFEITEHTLMEDTKGTLDTLRALARLGASISVDDFGTGYSSLSYLKRFSVQRLKIDRSFVAEITEKHDTAAIVEAILSLARSLYIEVVAEGVESAGQRDFLASRGCALMQGYLFCAALSPTQMEAMLKGDGTAWQKEPPIQDDAAPSAIPPERRVPAAAPLTSVGAVTTLRPRSAHS